MKGKTLQKIINIPKAGLKELPSLPDNEEFNVEIISKDSGKVYTVSTDALGSGEGGGGIESIVAGTNITIDNTDPLNPIVSASGGGSPGGSDTQIQYNNAGSFGADAGFTRDVATGNTNIAATTGVNTFGFKLDNNILGAGFSGSVLSASDTGGDSLVSGLFDYAGVPSWIDFYAYADSNAFQSFKTKNVYSFTLGNVTGSTAYTSSSNTFTLASNLSGAGGQGISQSGGITSIGNVSGATGNNTKISIDDVNEHITISNLPAYDDDTAAGVGGLTTGMVYMTTGSGSAPLNAAGILMIKQ